LAGEATLESLILKPEAVYAKHDIECRLGIGAESIDRSKKVLSLDDGTHVSYDKLVLATGGRPRRLSLPGSDHSNVHYIRTIGDILKLQPQFKAGKNLLIIGGGYIGLEAASVGIKKGLNVTVIEALPRVLARVTAPEISAFYERVHRSKGVDIRTGVGVHGFEGDPLVTTVVLADGARLPADVIVVGVGLIPNTELAETAGLEINNGIVADLHCRTADPDIYAIGDCSNHDNGFLGRRLRLESVPNALEQARVVALDIVGKPTPNASVPWFWSDQYDLKLQMVGLSQGYDQIVIRGDLHGDSFCAFYLDKGVMISADGVNRPQEFMVAKRLVAERRVVPVAVLQDESQPFKAILSAV
jgi:3-phenylpropionate/trans-cinnamate dioxygenase ferredoxin reductase subunit